MAPEENPEQINYKTTRQEVISKRLERENVVKQIVTLFKITLQTTIVKCTKQSNAKTAEEINDMRSVILIF